MERYEQQNKKPVKDPAAAYEPPMVEDLDTSQGPVVTPAGGTGGGSTITTTNATAAPREF